ncbi:MAG: hypothetical protein LBT46_07205 [Planctomycetaceae bacterium]|jgi:hypothetical protein|nr:hypothetical protein [Planctomycetaceae bacterium]
MAEKSDGGFISTNVKEYPCIAKYRVIEEAYDSERCAVQFIIEAKSSSDAYNFALLPGVTEQGIKLAKKAGLERPGLADRGIPIACDQNGNTDGNIPQPKEGEHWFCSITYGYLGGD